MAIEVIRDLIYKEENDILLHMYRSMYRAKKAGAPVDLAEMDMLENYLSCRIPLWLAQNPYKANRRFGVFNYAYCESLPSVNPYLFRIMEKVYFNEDNEIHQMGGAMCSLSFNVYRPLNLTDDCTHLVLHFHSEFIDIDYINIDKEDSGIFSDFYSIGESGIDVKRENLGGFLSFNRRVRMTLKDTVESVNNMIGIKDYFREDGRVSDRCLLK